MKNMGTITGRAISSQGVGIRTRDAGSVRVTDSAIQSGLATLRSELEKRDSNVRAPLTSITYPRDIPVKVGGGWVEFISAMSIDYGVTGGSSDGAVSATGANGTPIIQANFEKDTFNAHVFAVLLRIGFIDMQRGNLIGRSLDTLLTEGIRLEYDKHMDVNVYTGLPTYGSTGLLNNPNVTATGVSQGAAGTTPWTTKTPDEILKDINSALIAVWTAAGYDRSALPNHITIPYQQYNYIATTRLTDTGETILKFILENNITQQNGGNLVIAATAFNAGAGASGSDRMCVYVNNDRFLAVEELQPLSRILTAPNVTDGTYDSRYAANISEVEVFYPQTIGYFDGI
jgi:hypothetical protein